MAINEFEDVESIDADMLSLFEKRLRSKSADSMKSAALIETAKYLKTTSELKKANFAQLNDFTSLNSSEILLGIAELTAAASDVDHIAQVEASEDYWHAGFSLEPNTTYGVTPSHLSRWTISRKGMPRDQWEFSYDESFDPPFHYVHYSETPVGLPHLNSEGKPYRSGRRIYDKITLGYVNILVWHHQPDGSAISQIDGIYESAHTTYSIGPHGGSMHFYIPDFKTAYADNAGHCMVYVKKV